MHPPILPGTLLHHRYRLIGVLAQGSIGWTYLAEDQKRVGELCVLKEVAASEPTSDSLPTLRETFQQEASRLYELHHPQIPRFRVVITHLDRLLWVEEYIPGKTYRTLLSERLAQAEVFSEAEVVQLLWQVLPVLNYIHRRSVIHGNLSLDTLIAREPDRLPVLTHFGTVQHIANRLRLFTQTEPEFAPVRLGFVGAEGTALENDRSLDFYTLAVTALMLLTGQAPETLYDPKKQTWQWQLLGALNPRLTRVLKQMLLQKPKLRYHSAAQIAQALKPIVHAAPEAIVTPTLPTFASSPSLPTALSEPWTTSPKSLIPEHLAPESVATERVGIGSFAIENSSLEDFTTDKKPSRGTATLPVLPSHASAFSSSSLGSPSDLPPSISPEESEFQSAWHVPENAAIAEQGQSTFNDPPESFQVNPRQIRQLASIGIVVILGFIGWKLLFSPRPQPLVDSASQPTISVNTPAPSARESLPPATSQTLTSQEQAAQKALRDRRRSLNLRHDFFADLVDEVFYAKHPDLKGQSLSLQPAQQALRMEWNAIAEGLLNRLKALSPTARKKLGGYGQADYDRWTAIVQQNNLSIRTLQILTDVRFTYLFPEQSEQSSDLGQFSQVWYAVMEDQLQAIRTNAILQTIQLPANGLSQASGVLNVGQAKVYVVRLEKDQAVQLTLQAPAQSTRLFIYAPAQSSDRALLENSTNLTWFGKMPQSGYYEIVIVSNAPETVGYQLKLSQQAEG
jgi:serine/threonine protein kinase